MMLKMEPKDWDMQYSTRFPKNLAKTKSGWGFSLVGKRIIGSVFYKQRLDLGELNSKSILVGGEIKCSANAEFFYKLEPANRCDVPAKFRILLCQDMYGGQFDRWYSKEGCLLQDGKFSFKVDLKPENWSSVYGKVGEDFPHEFNRVRNSSIELAIVFGGGCFFAHGVRMATGSAFFDFSTVRV